MNSARDLLRSYMEILSEAPAAPAPTPKAGLAQPPAAGASRPAAAPAPQGQTATAPAPQGQTATAQPVDDEAFKRDVGTTAKIDTEGGGTVQQNKLTGLKTVSSEKGAVTTDAGNNAVKYQAPSIGGFSGEKDYTTGDVTQSFNTGDVGVSGTRTAGGYEKEKSSMNQMGAVRADSSWKAPNIAGGQLASPTITNVTAAKDDEGNRETAQLATGVGFGGASGKTVGNNTIDVSGNKDLANVVRPAVQGVDFSTKNFSSAEGAKNLSNMADQVVQQQQQAPAQQPVSEEDTHEHPESARHLLKKLLKLLKDEDKVDEDFIPTDPKEVGAKMNEPYISPAARAQNKPNPHANAPEPKKIDAKTTAVPDAQFEEKKIEESLMHLYKAIKEGRIQ
jgi:hypothetical protein